MEIANEFISDKGLDMEKIELPKVKRGRKTIHHTEEERKEAKRVTQKKYLENTRKKNSVLMEQDRERSKKIVLNGEQKMPIILERVFLQNISLK